jgi:hypothetical protein
MPALIYLFLGLVGVLVAIGKVSGITLVVKTIFILAWTWFLNYLCESGYSSISWFLVILPFIIFFLMVFFAFEVIVYAMKNGVDTNVQTTAASK